MILLSFTVGRFDGTNSLWTDCSESLIMRNGASEMRQPVQKPNKHSLIGWAPYLLWDEGPHNAPMKHTGTGLHTFGNPELQPPTGFPVLSSPTAGSRQGDQQVWIQISEIFMGDQVIEDNQGSQNAHLSQCDFHRPSTQNIWLAHTMILVSLRVIFGPLESPEALLLSLAPLK